MLDQTCERYYSEEASIMSKKITAKKRKTRDIQSDHTMSLLDSASVSQSIKDSIFPDEANTDFLKTLIYAMQLLMLQPDRCRVLTVGIDMKKGHEEWERLHCNIRNFGMELYTNKYSTSLKFGEKLLIIQAIKL